MCDIVCPYKDKCTSYPGSCGSCTRNTGKRNYYRPRTDWYYPWYPGTTWEPYVYPYWQITDGTGDNYTRVNDNTLRWNISDITWNE